VKEGRGTRAGNDGKDEVRGTQSRSALQQKVIRRVRGLQKKGEGRGYLKKKAAPSGEWKENQEQKGRGVRRGSPHRVKIGGGLLTFN